MGIIWQRKINLRDKSWRDWDLGARDEDEIIILASRRNQGQWIPQSRASYNSCLKLNKCFHT